MSKGVNAGDIPPASSQLDTWTSLPTKEYDGMKDELRHVRDRLATARQILGKIGNIVDDGALSGLSAGDLEYIRTLVSSWKRVDMKGLS